MVDGVNGNPNIRPLRDVNDDGLNNFADKRKATIEQEKKSIFGDNSTKEIKRYVNGKEETIIVGKKDGQKIRYMADENGHLKELVATSTEGKNTYTTREEFDAKLMEKYGTTQAELKKSGITVEFRHGKFVFTQNSSGKVIPDNVLAQLEAQHKADLAKNAQPKELPGFVKVAVDATQNLVADGVIESNVVRHTREQAENYTNAAKKAERIETEKKIQELLDSPEMAEMEAQWTKNVEEKIKKDNDRTLAHNPKPQGTGRVAKKRTPSKMDGNVGIAPDAEIIGEKARIGRLNRKYPRLVTRQDKMKQVGGSTYTFIPPKPEGTENKDAKNEITFGYEMYEKVKIGNKEVFIRANLKEEEKEALIKAETETYQNNKKNYETNIANGKEFAKLFRNVDNPNLNNTQLTNASKNLDDRYFRGFMKGIKSENLVGKNMMTSVYLSKSATPETKKNFALKLLKAAQPWAKKDNVVHKYKDKTYTCESLIKEINEKGLTQDLAYVSNYILYGVKL